ncbi:MAG: M48 family metallopeptidase [Selenomonadaceae bacterium]|nr:M48 family metallopeptidase [Selenomonadaceae bacterium]
MGLKKKFLATLTAAALSISLTFGTPATAEAALAGDLIGAGISIGIQAAQLNAEINKKIRYYDTTEQGRRELYNSFRKNYGVSDNPEYNEQLDKIMANLTKGVAAIDPTIKSKPYLYFVSNQDSINAACSMGHVMMVNAGTFKKVINEDEIAAIVGHEMGHGQKNHVAKSNKKHLRKQITAAVAGTAIGATIGGGQLTSIITQVALKHSVAHGDRKQETEADLLGFEYITHTNYNPGACAAVMQRFVEMEIGSKQSGAMAFFNPSDHPDSAKRRDAYVKRLYEYSKNHVTAKNAIITVNNKTLMKVAASPDMSAAERSYFVLGNLATAYHKGQNTYAATVKDGMVMLGNQPIVAPIEGDEDAQTIADRLNAIK